MGGGQPYMYDAPRFDYSFNPKRVTHASWEVPPPSPPKPRGPLLDFNRHPDSYVIVSSNKSNVRPMRPKVKDWIRWVRWTQFSFRVMQIVGAIGMLICVICITNTQNTEGWILRLPPAFDLLCTSYAIYHLFRAAKGRTPASSASYHLFALFCDIGLIPFYVFTALMSHTNHHLPLESETRWKSFFKDPVATNKILYSAWLISIACGGLHLVSVGFDLYLVLIFRAIARLPPDMNPLEDNLTSRSRKNKSKHKSKTSSLSGATFAEKRSSESAHSKEDLSDSEQYVQSPPPRIPESLLPDSRPMSFFHSRHGSDPTFSAHTPHTARLSRTQFQEASAYHQLPSSNRASRVEPYEKTSIRRSKAQARRSVYIDPTANPGEFGDPRARRKSQLMNDNWFVHDSADAPSEYDPYGETYNVLNGITPTRRTGNNNYAQVPQYHMEDENYAQGPQYHVEDEAPQPQPQPEPVEEPEQGKPEPLRMNPPTPPAPAKEPPKGPPLNRDYTSASVDSVTSIYSRPVDEPAPPPVPPKSSPPKRRYYGDLAAATRGVRQQSQSPRPQYHTTPNHQTEHHGGVVRNGPDRSGHIERGPRVVSRTGIDLDEAKSMYMGVENTRGRDVSGKVAEEGRGGAWSMRSRKVSGVA